MKKIIEQYKYGIKTIIKNITGSYNEDLEQEVYVKTWKNKDKYIEQNKFKQWINKITSNTCKDYLKSAYFKNTQKTDSQEDLLTIVKDEKPTPETILSRKERQETILHAINKLPKKMKEIIILYDMYDMNYNEISEKLKCPVGTVKSRLFNARKELSVYLENLL